MEALGLGRPSAIGPRCATAAAAASSLRSHGCGSVSGALGSLTC
jgi:hypothetical protein